MLVVRQVTSGEDAQKARTLLQEHLKWVGSQVSENSKVELDIEPMLEESLSEIKTQSASSACFLLAFLEYEAAGVASLRVRYLISMDYT
ncbi:MAG TPA: hypothetical protein VMX75_05345 [Spirochaetia bacterium]|nr:hypothetical protein [Spirochaetia bacterium]